jgi:hypothetical protein
MRQHGSVPVDFDANRQIGVSLDLSKNAKSEWVAGMGVPSPNAMAIPLNEVKQTGQNVGIGIKVAHATFKGTLNQEGTELSGQFSHEQDIVQLTLKKK